MRICFKLIKFVAINSKNFGFKHITLNTNISESPEQTRSPKLILPSILLDDNDMAFSKYLCSILKDVPKKKKRKIQADIIFKIIKEIDNDNK